MRRLRRLSLVSRMLIIIAIAVLAALALLGFVGAHIADSARESVLAERLQMTQVTAARMDGEVQQTLALITQASRFERFDLADNDDAPELSALSQLRVASRLLSVSFVADSRGLVRLADPRDSGWVGASLADIPAVRKAVETGEPQVSGLVIGPSSAGPLVVFTLPVRSKTGLTTGLIGGALDADSSSLRELLFAPRIAHPLSSIRLVDADGRLIAGSDSAAAQPVGSVAVDRASLLEFESSHSAGVTIGSSDEQGEEQVPLIIAHAPLAFADWGIVVEEPEAQALAPAVISRDWMLGIGAVCLFLTLGLVFLSAEALAAPVLERIQTWRRTGGDDLVSTPEPRVTRSLTAEPERPLERSAEALEAAVQKRTRALSILYNIDKAAAHSLALDELLDNALVGTADLLGIDLTMVFLLEADLQTLHLQVERGLPVKVRPSMSRMSLQDALAEQAATTLLPVLYHTQDLRGKMSPFLIREGIQTLVCVPLVSGARCTGVLHLGTRAERAFSPEEIDLLTSIGRQLGSAVQNVRLFEETKHRATRLAALNRIARVAGSTLDVDRILQAVSQEIMAIVRADIFSIALYDATMHELDYRLWIENGVPTAPEPRHVLPALAETIVEARKPLLVRNLSTERGLDLRMPEGTSQAPQSWLGVPLQVGNAMVGIMLVQSYAPDQYGVEEQELLSTIGDQLAVAIENARMFGAEQLRTVRLRAILQLSSEMANAPDARTLAEIVVQRAKEITASAACIMLEVEPGTDYGVVMAQSGLPPDVSIGKRIPLSLPLFQHSLQTGEPIILADIEKGDPDLEPILLRKDIRCFFACPLLHEGRTLGLFGMAGTWPYAPSHEEITLYQLMAQRGAAGLENLRLNRETRRRLEELEAMFDVSGALRDIAGAEPALQTVVTRAVQVLQANTGSISLIEGNRVVCRAAVGVRGALVGQSIAIGQGITGRVAATGCAYVSTDYDQEVKEGPDAEEIRGCDRIASDICVPLKIADQVIGVMHVSTFARHEFTEGQERLLTAIANMAASALRRATLFEELEDNVQNLGTLFEVGKAVTSSVRLQDVLSLVADVAPRALEAAASFVFLWDEQENALVMRAATGFSPEAVGQLRCSRGRGLAGWTFAENRTANIQIDESNARWLTESEPARGLLSTDAETALAVPLRLGSATLGVIGVINKSESRPFTPADESLLSALASQVAIAIEHARLYEDLRDLSIASIRSLVTAIDARDSYTHGHSQQVAQLAVRVARSIGWPSADLEKIEYAALLHDIGKLAVPDNVLQNPGALSPEAWAIIHQHPFHSARIVEPIHSLQEIVPWIYHHQERWDGNGYPDGLSGESIPLGSRIIAIVDAYNAMITDRPYRKALTRGEAIEELETNAGSQFDPELVRVFISILDGPGE